MWVHDYAVDLCKKVFESYKMVTVQGLSNHEGLYKEDLQARSPYAHKIGNLSCHITDHGFLTIAGTEVEDQYKNYIKLEPIDVSHFSLPEKYVTVTTGFTSKTREWLPESVNKVSDYLNSIGYTPVYIGKSYTPSFVTQTKNEAIKGTFKADYTKGINLIDKTNLFEAHSIMANSKAVLGLDNGLVHLAAMSDVPLIIGFTTVNPLHRLPYRNNIKGYNCLTVTPTKEELKCVFCQSNMSFADSSHSFTECFYSDLKCLELMNAEKWIKEIDKCLHINHKSLGKIIDTDKWVEEIEKAIQEKNKCL